MPMERVARWSPGVRAGGCHMFGGDSPCLYVDPVECCVLHYESTSLDRWILKYQTLARRMTDRDMHSVPFGFYHNSVQAVRDCESSCSSGDELRACLRRSAERMFRRCRLAPPSPSPGGSWCERVHEDPVCGRTRGRISDLTGRDGYHP